MSDFDVENLRIPPGYDEQEDRFLSKSIDESMHTLSNLETTKEKLTQQFNELNEKFDELDAQNEEYSGQIQPVPHYSSSHQNLEFFDQLKILEAEAEHYNSQIKAHNTNITELTSEITNAATRQKRLLQQIEELKDSLNTASDTANKRAGTITQLWKSIDQEDDEIYRMQQTCAQIKKDIQAQAESMKEISPEAMQQLVLQKDALVKEVRKAETQKKKLEIRKAQKSSKHLAQENNSQKGFNKESSPLMWMAERNALLIKIKKAREELQQLATRSKSATKSKQRTEMKKEQLNFSEEDVKKAIFLELQEVENADDSFVDDAIATEEHYQQELNQRMTEIEQTTTQIFSFKDNMMELMKQQDEIAESNDRLELLREELKELRSKF